MVGIFFLVGDELIIESKHFTKGKVMHLNRGVKEISKRDGVTAEKGREVKVGKLKSATSKRDVPLNDTAIEMILDLKKNSTSERIHL